MVSVQKFLRSFREQYDSSRERETEREEKIRVIYFILMTYRLLPRLDTFMVAVHNLTWPKPFAFGITSPGIHYAEKRFGDASAKKNGISRELSIQKYR